MSGYQETIQCKILCMNTDTFKLIPHFHRIYDESQVDLDPKILFFVIKLRARNISLYTKNEFDLLTRFIFVILVSNSYRFSTQTGLFLVEILSLGVSTAVRFMILT